MTKLLISLSIWLILVCSIQENLVAQQNSIIGKWKGTAPNQDIVTLTFNKNLSMVWEVITRDRKSVKKDNYITHLTKGKYTLDITTIPVAIKIFDLDEAYIQKMKIEFFGNVEFLNRDKIKLTGKRLISSVDKTMESKQFPEETIVLEKVE